MLDTKIVFFGTSELAATILEKLTSEYKISAVITRADQPVGRKQVVTPSPLSLVAEKHNIPTLKPVKLNSEFTSENRELLEADLYVVAAYGKIIPQAILDIPTHGAINVHPSLLPKYRGASPIISAILNGDKTSGVTIMQMDEQMDHGPILAVEKIEIGDNETNPELSLQMAEIGAELLVKTIPGFLDGSISPQSQDETQATFCKLISKNDGYFDIDNSPSAEVLDRMTRAYDPWPNVWTRWNDKVVKFYPGDVMQMEGKNKVSKADFLRGYPDFPIK